MIGCLCPREFRKCSIEEQRDPVMMEEDGLVKEGTKKD